VRRSGQEDEARPRASSSSRAGGGYVPTIGIGLVSAAVVAVGMSRAWVKAAATVAGLPRIEVSVTGAELESLAGALGVVLLAAFGAVMATRSRTRQAVGLLLVAGAVVVLVAAVHAADPAPLLQHRLAAKGWSPGSGYTASTQAWRWLVAAGAVGCLVTGVLVVARGRAWATMGRRYDAPATMEPPAEVGEEPAGAEALEGEALWRALDEGRDPTRGP
jgi:uncharacterized membrane protein (TIGR02234 family)